MELGHACKQLFMIWDRDPEREGGRLLAGASIHAFAQLTNVRDRPGISSWWPLYRHLSKLQLVSKIPSIIS